MLNWGNYQTTVELRELVESGVKVWDFEYPSYYSGDKKAAFEKKVLDHFWVRQIGQETVGRFLHYFRSRIREIMPYYIQLYKSVERFESEEDPLESYHLEETFVQKSKDNGSSESVRKFSDTPQGSIDNLDKYLTEGTQEGGSTRNDGEVTHTLIRKGNIGVQTMGEEIIKNRQAILNVDLLIIEELEDLFLQVY